MVYVYSCIYYHNNDYEIREHRFEHFEDACNVVAEIWVDEHQNVYTIIDDRDFYGEMEYPVIGDIGEFQ